MTLQEVTEAHSRRLSNLHQRRDADLREASLLRDAELRALPAAGRLYERLDADTARALDARTRADLKAAANLESALDRAVSDRSRTLADLQAERKAANLRLLDEKQAREAAAEAAYRAALSGLDSTTPLPLRQKAIADADRQRQNALEKAAAAYASEVARAQDEYRAGVTGALAGEREAERKAELASEAAMRVARSAYDAAVLSAERALVAGLEAIAEAAGVMQAYETRAAGIRSDAAKEEERLFERFREELKAVELTSARAPKDSG